MPDGLLYLDKDFFVGSESHLLTECKSPYLNLCAVKSLELTFSRLENYLNIVTLSIFLITIFSLTRFPPEFCKQINFPYLSTSFQFPSWLLSKSSFSAFSILFPEFQFYTSWQLYLAIQFFLLIPSRTAIDEYCHNIMSVTLALILCQ